MKNQWDSQEKVLNYYGRSVTKHHDAGQEMIQQLKEKFDSTEKKSLKMQVLTILPKSWTIQEVQEEFGVSKCMAKKAKALVREHGILAMPNPNAGNLFRRKLITVMEFYLSEPVSRQMPGMKDYISVLVDGEKQHVQKHLVLCNLKEAHELFKENHPDNRIVFLHLLKYVQGSVYW